ncbi:MAG TPA: D-ribose pyranase [Chloroflexota bacterium]|nr:D-ribose pyranase [Chloroflexota bacterium]
MKKTTLLNSRLSRVIASMGHTDMLVVSDAGFPVPPDVLRVDLAVTAGLPGFLEVVQAIGTELEVEGLILANELVARDSPLPAALQGCFPQARVEHMSHDQFKSVAARARAVVRTGECTPYANVILISGVTY